MAKTKIIPTLIPPPIDNITDWLIIGLDPSMSRTGYAIMHVNKSSDGSTLAKWLSAGSVKPEVSSDPIWVRGKIMSLHLRDLLVKVRNSLVTDNPNIVTNLGLIISMEYPTPMNDFLVALNRIIHLVFFETNHVMSLGSLFSDIKILTTNASTLRSLMGLTKTGVKNKKENIIKAYEYIDKTSYPKLDTDACDAVLLAMMARYTTSILLGNTTEIPEKFLISLCNSTQEVKGKGRRAHIITKGLLHRKEYFYGYKRKLYTLVNRDASIDGREGIIRQNYEL